MPKISGQSLIPLVKHNDLYSNANITLSVLYTLVQIDLARVFVTADFDGEGVQRRQGARDGDYAVEAFRREKGGEGS